MKTKVIILLSGGLDSQVLLAWCKQKTTVDIVGCLGFNYNQRHIKELIAAQTIADRHSTPFQVIKIPTPGRTCLTDKAVSIPKGLPGKHPGQKATIVPGRNALFLSAAIGPAADMGAECIFYAAHKGDSIIYPDCRPEFVNHMNSAFKFAYNIGVTTPMSDFDKKELVKIGRELQEPLEMSWSCYEGSDSPCEQCGACIERKTALS